MDWYIKSFSHFFEVRTLQGRTMMVYCISFCNVYIHSSLERFDYRISLNSMRADYHFLPALDAPIIQGRTLIKGYLVSRQVKSAHLFKIKFA